MSTPTRDEILFAAGGDVWTKYGTFVRRTLPQEEASVTFSRASEGAVVDRSLNLRMVESGAIRPTWVDGQSEYAVRLEAARTNQLTRTEDFSHSDWTATNLSLSADSVEAPDNNTTADTLTEDSSTATHHVAQAKSLTADADYAISGFFKPSGRDWVYLRLHEDATPSNNGIVWFDVSSGSVGTESVNGTGSVVRSRIKEMDNGWHRCMAVVNVGNSATSIEARYGLADADNSQSYAGDGSSGLEAWGVQVEDDASFASSYRQSTSSAATRNKDDYSTDFEHGPQALTVYADFIERGTVVESSSGRVLSISDAAPLFNVQESGGFYRAIYNNGSQSSTATLSAAPNLDDRVEIRAVLNDDGSVIIGQSIGGASESTATGSGATLQRSWGARTFVFGNQTGTTPAYEGLMRVRVATGVRTMQEMRDIEL